MVAADSVDLTTAFESETCSRCAGSGQYSYCQSYGHTCFKCRGKGRTYTKRAEAALAWATEQRTVKASEVQVGWLLYVAPSPLGGKSGWFPVDSIKDQDGYSFTKDADGNEVRHYYTTLSTSQMAIGTFPDSPVQAVPTRERLKEIRAAALQYQATLTKTGTVRKRAA